MRAQRWSPAGRAARIDAAGAGRCIRLLTNKVADALVGFVLKITDVRLSASRCTASRDAREIGRLPRLVALSCCRLRRRGGSTIRGCAELVERIFVSPLRPATRWSMGTVVRFHTAHKLTLMAHMPEAYQRLGRLVASGKSMARRDFQDRYSSEFMTALQAIATPRRQANVLQHMLGCFKQALDRESRAELLALIQDYGGGRVPLVVPLTLFAHHIRRCGVPYLADQVYLRPHPVELMLRNHV